jgi:DNA polymerase-3 subunit gamma/tau
VARTKAAGAASTDGLTTPAPEPRRADAAGYTVVARRYRPQRFEDVVGQDHVVQSLRNAIRLNKVTHAYLFSGTRGVGKTSIARIFAKCLNCVRGPTDEPCLECDICRAIAVGQDVDVIEIDGASNNGVEQVRELRQNAGLRPSRARFKIYYIDEVHMLSTGAFNALLKTLEEPPEHVKFFFATTEKSKIPITVLSRCQVYDFAGIGLDQIVATLAGICERERVEVEPDALRAVARRAGGSMRDAQSLLEQLLSSGEPRLSADRVHQLLGTAPDDRILDLVEALADHDLARTLTLLDGSVAAGVQPVDLLGGVLEFLRDAMVLSAGADVSLLAAGSASAPRLKAVVERWPIDSILAALQILAEARGRLRGSPHARILVENALARVARLEDLAELGEVVARLGALEAGAPAPSAPSPAKKKSPAPAAPARPEPVAAPAPVTPAESGPASGPLTLEAAQGLWPTLVANVGAEIGTSLNLVRPTALGGPDVLVIDVPAMYNWVADAFEKPEKRARIEAELRTLTGRPATIQFRRAEPPAKAATPPAPARTDELASDPLVQKMVQLFEARPVHVEYEADE